MGGSDPVAPAAPAPAQSGTQTYKQTVQDQIDMLGPTLAAQQQYAPQYNQQQLDQLNQYGPEYAKSVLDLQQQFAPQYKLLSDTLNPEIGVAQSTLADYLGGSDNAEYDALLPGIQQSIRAGQSSRGLGAISPLGSIDESVQLAQLKQSLKDRRLNIALSTAGRVPIGGMQNIQANSGTGQLVQGPSADAMVGYQSSINSFNSSIFNTQGGIYGSQLQQQGNPLGSILGGVSGGITGSLMGNPFGALSGAKAGATTCWVAATVFDGWDDIRTINARKFILNDAPRWFRDLYILKGEQFAKFISNKNWLKNLIRPLFTWMAKKGAI